MKYLFYLLIFATSLFSRTLDEVIESALENSTLLKQADAQIRLSKLNRKESEISRYGELNAIVDATHYNIERTLAPLTPSAIGSGTAITTAKDIFSVGVAYSLPLFTGFAQTAQVDIDDISKNISQMKRKLTKEQLIYNVRTLYLSILAQKELAQAQKTYQDALGRLSDQIAYEVRIGKKAQIDLLKAQSDLKAAQTTLKSIMSNINITKSALEALVGETIDRISPIKITLKDPASFYKSSDSDLSSLLKVKLEEMQLKKADKEVKKSNAAKYPQISLNSYLGRNYGKDIKNKEWDNETLWQVGINLRYNVFDFGKRDIKTQKAKIARIKSSLKRDRILLDLRRDLAKAVELINKSRVEYEGNLARLNLTEKSEKIEEIRYENDAATLNDLLLAKAGRRLASANVIQSRYEYQKNIYYLDYLLESGVKK